MLPRTKLFLSDLCSDIIFLICDHLQYIRPDGETPIKHLSCLNHRLRHIIIPYLFKSIYINKPLSQLTPSPLIYHHAQTFKIDMFGSMWWWCSGSYMVSADALHLFRRMHDMPKLRTLEVSMMDRSVDIFTAAFDDDKIEDKTVFILNTVEKLVVTSTAAFLVTHCPNITSLVIEDQENCSVQRYIDIITRLAPLHTHSTIGARISPNITHFEATALWSAAEITGLVDMFPNLRYLAMRVTHSYHAPLFFIIHTLSERLKYLNTLQLGNIGNFSTDFRAPWHRDIREWISMKLRRMCPLEAEKLRVQAENTIARLAFGSLLELRECWLGDKRVARRIMGGDGDGMQWMWERNLRDLGTVVNETNRAGFKELMEDIGM
jgi:hypothetical protein